MYLLTVLEYIIQDGDGDDDNYHLLSFYYLLDPVHSSFPEVNSGSSLPNLSFLQPSPSQVTPIPSLHVLK